MKGNIRKNGDVLAAFDPDNDEAYAYTKIEDRFDDFRKKHEGAGSKVRFVSEASYFESLDRWLKETKRKAREARR